MRFVPLLGARLIDVGGEQDWLVCIGEMANHDVNHPHDEVSVGDSVEVVVQSVGTSRWRIELSMKVAK